MVQRTTSRRLGLSCDDVTEGYGLSNTPRVSVILPLYNGERYVAASIASLLSQSFGDFELLVIDDGSTDRSAEIVLSVTDPRVLLVRQQNSGLPSALNKALQIARGEYIARQDHDDLSLPTRLDKQVLYLEQHPETVLLGTAAEIWIDNSPTGRFHDHPCDDIALRFELLFDNPFVHSSVMVRADAVRVAGGYPLDLIEDYSLWSKLARLGRVANLPERLVVYREVPSSVTRSVVAEHWRQRLACMSSENLAHVLRRNSCDDDILSVAALYHRAWNSLPGSVTFRQLQAVVADAAAAISDGAGPNDLPLRARRVVRKLLFRSLQFRFWRLQTALRASPKQ